MALAGCGGDGGPAEPPAPGAAERYRLTLSAQCAAARFDRDALALPDGTSAAALEGYLRDTLAVQRRYERELRALAPPIALLDEHNEALAIAAAARRVTAGAADAAGERGADPDAILRELEPAANAQVASANALAERLDAPQCRVAEIDLGFSAR